jgi:hypothetical protein
MVPAVCAADFAREILFLAIRLGYGLDDPGSKSRWTRDLPLFQDVQTGSSTSPVSYSLGSRGSLHVV